MGLGRSRWSLPRFLLGVAAAVLGLLAAKAASVAPGAARWTAWEPDGLAYLPVVFGALHVFSRSEAEGITERTLFAVGAMALGFVCAVSGVRTGAVWMAVGVPSGFYPGTGSSPTEAVDHGVQSVAQSVVTVVVGLLVIGLGGRRGRRP